MVTSWRFSIKNRILVRTLLPLGWLWVLAAPQFAQANTPTSGPRDQLQQLTAQLQQSPGDQTLRKRIITLALALDPKPATPDAATMAEGAAEYAFMNAKAGSDYSDAAKQYERALLLAPWLAADYFNCGVAHEKAGENAEAVRSFALYLLAAPNADDAQAVKKRIGGLEYAAQKAADLANSPEAQLERFFASLDGGVWRCEHDIQRYSDGSQGEGYLSGITYLAVKGRQVSYNWYLRDVNGDAGHHWTHVDYEPTTPPDWTVTLTSHKFIAASQVRTGGFHMLSDEFTISADGRTITEEQRSFWDSTQVETRMTATFVRIK